MDIGILNLTRFGDLIQTSPVLAGLRRRHPEARIHLIIKTRFRPVARLLPGIDVVHEIDGDALAQAMCEPETPFLVAYQMVREIVGALRDTHFDVVYNFTHSRSSAVLLSLLRARRTVGFTLDRNGQRRVDDDWLTHMGTLVRARRLVRMNLVDTYLGAAGLAGSGERLSVTLTSAARERAELLVPEGTKPIAVQLGASQDTKTWTIAHFAETLRALAERNVAFRPVLVGVAAEAPAGEKLVQLCPELSFQNLIGSTAIDELGAVLERCALLLTGDTGTMHLAAAVGTKTCSVFVGLGNPYETAPYAEGHYTVMSRISCAPCSHLVKCGYPACHDDIDPTWLAELLELALEGGDTARLSAPPRADLFVTRFDRHGLLELCPVHARPPRAHDLLAIAYREVFGSGFMKRSPDLATAFAEAEAAHDIPPHEWAERLPRELLEQIERLCTLGSRGKSISLTLPRSATDPAALRRVGESLAGIDEQIYTLGRAQPLLAPLALAHEGEAESLPDGSSVDEVASASAAYYGRLAERAALLEHIVAGQVSGAIRPPQNITQELPL